MLHSWRLTSVTALLALIAGAASAQSTLDAPAAAASRVRPSSLTIAYSQYLWPKVGGIATVYYLIDPASDPNAKSKITSAIGIFNADFPNVIRWRALPSGSNANYVDINLSAADLSGVCEANEGYEAIKGQPMTGSTNCTLGTILHEMGHVIGLWHEQSRPDRASYIDLYYRNVIKGSWSNFLVAADDAQTIGAYDYASVMQYIPFAFSATGGPVIETIPAGIPLGGYAGVPALATSAPAMPSFDYSAGDKEAIERLYGAPPTSITVTSNPVGLSVIVDGVTVTTPQTYSWPLYSSHTLDVPSEVQTLAGAVLNSNPLATTTFYYTYGRWNDSTAQAHTITVTPGDGSLPFPVTAPQLATYSANFIQLVPYTSSISPASSGQIAVSPAPQAYPGVTGEFFVAREQVTLTATPASGWAFYEFNNSPFWLPGGLGANPKTFYVPDTGNPVATTVEFSNTPVYKVDVQPETFSANMAAYVDGGFVYTPKNFSTPYDSSWTAGSSHSLNIAATQLPYSVNSRYDWASWSDGGAISHAIMLPSKSTKYTATVTREYQPATNFNFNPCGGTAMIAPSSGDGFYPWGQELSFTAAADSGWTFAGWTNDVTGTSNPAMLTADGETLVFANFNTVATPLTLTRLTPSSAAVGSAGFDLKLTGTGFSPTSVVFADGRYPTVTYVSPTTLRVRIPPGDLKKLGGFQVYVENFPTGSTGCAVFAYQTFLVGGAGAPAATPTFSPQGGAYSTAQMVSIGDAITEPTPTIHYTTDGSTPTADSPVYSAAITVGSSETLQAVAVVSGYTTSAPAVATYSIGSQASTPGH